MERVLRCSKGLQAQTPTRGPDEGEDLRKLYREARNSLRSAIRDSKRSSWRKLCQQVESDPWGLPYKLVTKKLIGRSPIQDPSPDRLQHVVETLFPTQTSIHWLFLGQPCFFPEITDLELKTSCRQIPLGKAPGLDGVPDLIIKHVAVQRPELFRDVYNTCLRDGVFPAIWKRAKLVLLRKGNKPPDQPSSYIPIYLLDT